MADRVWPFGLPTQVLSEGYSYTPGQNLVATDMDVGQPKVRRRSSNRPAAEQFSVVVDWADFETFRQWFETDLAQGALTFEFGTPGAPILDDLTITDDDGDPLTDDDGDPLLLDYPWITTQTYRFDPTSNQPWQMQPIGGKWLRLTCSVLRLD